MYIYISIAPLNGSKIVESRDYGKFLIQLGSELVIKEEVSEPVLRTSLSCRCARHLRGALPGKQQFVISSGRVIYGADSHANFAVLNI